MSRNSVAKIQELDELDQLAQFAAKEIIRIAQTTSVGYVQLSPIYSFFGIQIQRKNILHDGIIESDGNSYKVTLNSKMSFQRQRYTAAHELGHYVLDKVQLPEKFKRIQNLSQIELFCDKFAAYLLMPFDLLDPPSSWEKISKKWLTSKANQLQISIIALSRMLVKNLPSVGGFLSLRHSGKPKDSADRKWRVDFSEFPQEKVNFFLPKHKHLGEELEFFECLRNNSGEFIGWSSFVSTKKKKYIHSIYIKQKNLIVLFFYPEEVAKRYVQDGLYEKLF